MVNGLVKEKTFIEVKCFIYLKKSLTKLDRGRVGKCGTPVLSLSILIIIPSIVAVLKLLIISDMCRSEYWTEVNVYSSKALFWQLLHSLVRLLHSSRSCNLRETIFCIYGTRCNLLMAAPRMAFVMDETVAALRLVNSS